MRKVIFALLTTFLLMLSGCGGGGGGSSASSSTTRLGVFVDSQVSGIKYVAVSPNGDRTEGVTSTNGEFKYFEGGSVSFYIGNIFIGSSDGSDVIASMALGSTENEQTNIVRLLQTLDNDMDPSNGIQIDDQVSNNAKYINNLDVKSLNFEDDFNIIKSSLLSGTDYENRNLVDAAAAVAHATKSMKLATISEFPLGKAYAGTFTYPSNFNKDMLYKSQRRRIYLYLWQYEMSKDFDIPISAAAAIDSVETTHRIVKAGLDAMDTAMSLAALKDDTYTILSKMNKRKFKWFFTRSAALGASACSADDSLITAIDSTTSAVTGTDSYQTADLCTAINETMNSALPASGDITMQFLPALLKEFSQGAVFTFVGNKLLKESVPGPEDYILATTKIANDIIGAINLSGITQRTTDYLIARMWLSYYYQAAGDRSFMSNAIQPGNYTIVDREQQIRLIASKVASSDVWGDILDYLNIKGSDHLNYNYDNVVSMIDDTIAKMNSRYQQLNTEIGPFSNETNQIGLLELISVEASHNNVPEITASPATEIQLGNTYSYIPAASDADGDSLTYSITNKPEWATFNTATGQLSGTPTSTGTYGNITITVDDGVGGTNSVNFTITVTASISATSTLKKTGQTTSYATYDDGYYQTGVAPSYSRNSTTGIVTDNVTGLMWQDDVLAAATTAAWDSAPAVCTALNISEYGGYTDWRLPTIDELESIVDFGRVSPAINSVFVNTASNYYWSSTTHVNLTDRAWYVYFDYGNASANYKLNLHFVRCVRSGQ